jgi:hypothetical protein
MFGGIDVSVWSKYEILALSRCFPLCLQTQTLLDAVGTSHLCQQETWPAVSGQSGVSRLVPVAWKIFPHLSALPNLARSNSRQVQRGLNAVFQDLLRLDSVGDGPRELEGAHHEAEDGGRAAAARCRIGIRK